MPQFAVELQPLAADEAEAAERWYRERNEVASARFQRELDRAVDLISERPNTGSPYLGNTRHQTVQHRVEVALLESLLRVVAAASRSSWAEAFNRRLSVKPCESLDAAPLFPCTPGGESARRQRAVDGVRGIRGTGQ